MYSDPDILFNGQHERLGSFIEALSVQASFLDIVEFAIPDRNIFGAAWSRADALDWGIAKPFGQTASRILASHISHEELWDTDE